MLASRVEAGERVEAVGVMPKSALMIHSVSVTESLLAEDEIDHPAPANMRPRPAAVLQDGRPVRGRESPSLSDAVALRQLAADSAAERAAETEPGREIGAVQQLEALDVEHGASVTGCGWLRPEAST